MDAGAFVGNPRGIARSTSGWAAYVAVLSGVLVDLGRARAFSRGPASLADDPVGPHHRVGLVLEDVAVVDVVLRRAVVLHLEAGADPGDLTGVHLHRVLPARLCR